jgi:hypothetical protein
VKLLIDELICRSADLPSWMVMVVSEWENKRKRMVVEDGVRKNLMLKEYDKNVLLF